MPAPNFNNTLLADIGQALLTAYRADADLAAYYTGGITDVAFEDGVISPTAPTLLLAFAAFEERPQPGGWSELDTFWRVTSVVPQRTSTSSNNFLDARILMRLANVSVGPEHGVLRDASNNQLTVAAVGFQGFQPPEPTGDNTTRTRLIVTKQSLIDTATRQLV